MVGLSLIKRVCYQMSPVSHCPSRSIMSRRKGTRLTLKDKIEVIRIKEEDNWMFASIAKHFSVSDVVLQICKHKEKYKDAFRSGVYSSNHLCPAAYPELEEIV